MKTMLIPVDFTEASNNAVSYAAEWAKAYGYERIILLKTLYDSLFDNIIPSADYINVSQDYMAKERAEAVENLNFLCRELIAPTAPGIKVSFAVSENPLLRSILEIVEDEKPELIVAGSDNYIYSSNSFIGSQVISIAKISPIRVLIVPAHYTYQPVETALVPCNFNTMNLLSKVDSYQSTSAKWKEKRLLVLNVDPTEKYLHPDEEFIKAENALHEYLKNFQHELHYTNNKNIIDGIIDFAKNHEVQVIIALPGKRSFLYALTHKSISEAIYRNAKKPVLILK